MDRDKLLERLTAAFLSELVDHVRELNEDLLQLEKEPSSERRTELLQRLFRTAHSVKGSSRAASIELIESASSRLEETLAAVRDGRRELTPEVLDGLFELVDGIEDAGNRMRAGEGLDAATLVEVLARLGGRPPAAGAAPARPAPGEAKAPGAPTGETAAPGGAGTALETVRLPTERLDRLLALSGELRIARRLGRTLDDELQRLQRSIDEWGAEWRGAEPILRHAVGAPAPGKLDRTPAGRAASALLRQRDHLAGLRASLERIRLDVATDRRRIAQAAEPLVAEVRALRMLPFLEACRGLDRAVRDLSRQAHKEVELSVSGADVELDGAIIQALRAPLLHLVRNAVDHGIESPAERAAAGKPSQGRITVSALLRGSEVSIEVADDGRGLDLAAIREKARRQGMAVPADDREAQGLVFRPGFSTARMVTDVSGRGVGLDVVRRSVESLQGSVDVASTPGAGTRFILVTPLTLMSLRVLLVEAGGQQFALPASYVRRLVSVAREYLVVVEGRQAIAAGGPPVPVHSLADLLGLPRPEAERDVLGRERAVPFVLIGAGDRQIALGVEQLFAEQEVLVKSLGPRLRRVRHFSGAIIMPSGALGLVLHVPDLVATAQARAPGAVAYTPPAPPAARRRILLVDDSVTTRTLERTILESAGYHVRVAVDGAEAWERLQREGADLLVADVDMPRMDGITLTQTARASERFAGLPVVLVTALDTEQDKERGLNAGADAYLVKSSFDQRNLLETVEQLLGEPQE